MKRTFTLFFASFFALYIFGQNNLFTNGGFEEASLEGNWIFGVDVKNQAAATQELTTDVKEGTQSLHVNVSELLLKDTGLPQDRFDVRLQQTVAFEKGKSYELGFWSKGTAQANGLEFEIKFGNDGTKNILLEGTHKFDLTADWTYNTISFEVPADLTFEPNQALVSFLFIQKGDFYLDDITIKSPLIADGNFEGKSWTPKIVTNRGAVATISYLEDDVQSGAIAMKAEVITAGKYVYDINARTSVSIEDGRTITLSFYAKANTEGASLKCYLPQIFKSTSNAPEFLLSTQWAKYSVTLDYNVVNATKLPELMFYFHQEGVTYWLDNVSIEYSQSTAIGDIRASEKETSLYPNPVQDLLNIKSHKPITHADIFDLTGRLVANSTISNNQLNVQNLKTGSYLIRVADMEDNIQTLRFIKQ